MISHMVQVLVDSGYQCRHVQLEIISEYLTSINQKYNFTVCMMLSAVKSNCLLLINYSEFVDIENHTFDLQYSDCYFLSETSFLHVTLEHAGNKSN